MRKAILGLVVVLAVASIASAVPPTGTGGTIYFSSYDTALAEMRYYYLNVDSDWAATTSVTGFATVASPTVGPYGAGNGQNSGSRTPAERTYLVPNATTGGLNETTLNGAVLMQAVGGVTPGFVGINSDGTTTQFNSTATSVGMAAIVNPGVTPDGGWGIMQQGTGTPVTYKGTFTAAGMDTLSTNPTANIYSRTDIATNDGGGYNKTIASSAANQYAGNAYTLNGHLISGVAFTISGQTRPTGATVYGAVKAMYKNADDANYQIVYMSYNDANGYGGPGWEQPVIADVNGNGIPDAFYNGGGSVIRYQDVDMNGNFLDDGATVTGVPGSWGNMILAQVGAPDATYLGGHWVILQNKLDFAGSGSYVRVYGLDANGDYDATSAEIISSAVDGTLHLPTNGNTLTTTENKIYDSGMNFAPLVSTEAIPEPATLMLVGSGVLGLAGVLRRRMIS